MNRYSRACPWLAVFASLGYGFTARNDRISAATYGIRPLIFESSSAGTRGSRFVSRVAGHTVAFGLSGTVTETPRGGSSQPYTLLRFAGGRPNVWPQAVGRQSGTANYFVGSHPEQWRTNVPLFQKIQYPNLYPGIDLVYYGNQNRLEYDLVVAPGASWRSIRLAFRRAEAIEIGSAGDLKLRTASGWIMYGKPVVYQRGRRVPGHYVLSGRHEVRFEIGYYDPKLPLIIDPTLAYASYLGGSGSDYGHAVAVDSSGCAYVVGETGSADFPVLGAPGAMAGSSDVFVTKWDAAGTGVVYSTYIGGANRDAAFGVAVDATGNAYVTGFTYSSDFPITSGALRAGFVGATKAFVFKLNPSGSALVYSTFLGAGGDDYGVGIAVNAAGEAHIAGYTASMDFPVTAGAFQPCYGGGFYDGFLAKLNSAGSALIYATYLGGIGNDTATAVAVDPSGNIYVTGQTQSWNFPTANPVQFTHDESDAFVVKMDAAGLVMYATFLGGAGLNNGAGIVADAAGNAYITGFTNASDFPVTAGAYQRVNKGGYDGFVAKLNPYGSTILNATYLGGSGSDVGYSIALDGSGNVFVTGSTNSIDFPSQSAIQPSYLGGGDGFIAAFDNQLSSLLYATFFGGGGSDVVAALAVNYAGDAYVTGWTSSGASSWQLPITPGAYQPVAGGSVDAFLAKLSFSGSSLVCGAATPQPLTVAAGSNAQLIGDVVLSCTGGVIGQPVTANIQAALNTNLAYVSQPEIVVGADAKPVWGTVNGNTSILFQGVSFTAPGPLSATTLRITNLWADLSTVAAGEVVMTVSAASSSPPVTVAPAQQTVGVLAVPATPQVQQIVFSTGSAPAGCAAPSVASGFLVSDPQALVWFLVANTSSGDIARVDWHGPAGSLYQSHSFTVASGGTQCLWDSIRIAGVSPPLLGAWTVSVYWNNVLLASAPFVISTVHVPQLVWQNKSTRQATVHFYSSAPADVGWAWLNMSGFPGWRLAGVADMNGDGIPDLIWQNDKTRQVTVNYYGGAGGTVYQSWAYLNAAGFPGWTVVGVADMNGDGVPDLIWQNDTTKQVTVNYYNGAGGAVYHGWAWLNNIGNPGWSVVGVADFDGNGTPDLVWQNLATRQVTVNYYGGPGGAVCQAWDYLNPTGNPGWTVVGVGNYSGDGLPDLIWENDTTGQTTVNYYGGAGGAVYQGWNWLNGAGYPGWIAVPYAR